MISYKGHEAVCHWKFKHSSNFEHLRQIDCFCSRDSIQTNFVQHYFYIIIFFLTDATLSYAILENVHTVLFYPTKLDIHTFIVCGYILSTTVNKRISIGWLIDWTANERREFMLCFGRRKAAMNTPQSHLNTIHTRDVTQFKCLLTTCRAPGTQVSKFNIA